MNDKYISVDALFDEISYATENGATLDADTIKVLIEKMPSAYFITQNKPMFTKTKDLSNRTCALEECGKRLRSTE